MNDNGATKGYGEYLLQINRNLAVMLMVLSVAAVVLLPGEFTGHVFSVLVYSGIVLLLTLPIDYMFSVFRIVAELLSELLHLSRFTGFCSRHCVMCGLMAGGSSLILWLPLMGVLFSDRKEVWLMMFFVYAVIWAMFFHAAAIAERKEPLLDSSLELQKQQSKLFWVVWGLILSGCVTGCILPLVPYTADLFSGEQSQVTSYQLFLAAVCATGIILLGIIGVVYHRYEKSMCQAFEKIQFQNQIQQGEMYITLLTEKYRSLQRYQHDFKKHLAYIRQLAVQNRPEEIAAYIAVVQDDLQQGTLLRLTGNQTLDLLFSDYVQQAAHEGIVLQVQYQPQVKLHHISAPDLCIILGNLLDNAIAATAESEQKQIICEFWMKNNYYTAIQITNSCGQPPVLQDGVPQSTGNPEQHGYGVQNVIRCVRKYDGECIFRYDTVQKQFQVIILVPVV